jgi:hypothetical protein
MRRFPFIVLTFLLIVSMSSCSVLLKPPSKPIKPPIKTPIDPLTALSNEFPTGSYFSVTGEPCVHSEEGTVCNNNTCQLSNVITTMESDGRMDRVKKLMADNGFPQSVTQDEWEVARPSCWSCVAFATFVYHYLHGTDLLPGAVASNEITINQTTDLNQFFSQASRGDIIIFDRNGTKNHYAVFLRSDENNVYLYECNIGGTSDIRYNHQNTYTSLLTRYEGSSLQIIPGTVDTEEPEKTLSVIDIFSDPSLYKASNILFAKDSMDNALLTQEGNHYSSGIYVGYYILNGSIENFTVGDSYHGTFEFNKQLNGKFDHFKAVFAPSYAWEKIEGNSIVGRIRVICDNDTVVDKTIYKSDRDRAITVDLKNVNHFSILIEGTSFCFFYPQLMYK